MGNKNAEIPFYYKPFNGDSSIVNIDDYDEKYTVQIVKLDSFIKEKDLVDSKIKLIKLEAEGFEPEIIEGLRKNLKNVEYFQYIEVFDEVKVKEHNWAVNSVKPKSRI